MLLSKPTARRVRAKRAETMFSYYGSKSKIVDYYPPPKYKKIIEPFAGSARYSLKYWQNDVLLVEKNPQYVKLWQWLRAATAKDIDSLPRLKVGDDIRNFDGLCDEEVLLLRHIGQSGTATPGFICTNFGFKSGKTAYKNIKASLFKIRHWEIKCDDYKNVLNQNATWFIDPPYQFGGHKYKFSNSLIKFDQLSEWCKSREGQVIVCENTKADWLPFRPVVSIQGGANTNTTEAIWTNQTTSYGHIQTQLNFDAL